MRGGRGIRSGETVRILDRSGWDEWNRLVEERAEEPLFSATSWVERIAAAFGGRCEVLGRFEGGHLVGGVALPVRRRGGLSIATPPYLMPYVPILARTHQRRVVKALLPELARRYALVSLLVSPRESDLRSYLAAGWESAFRYTTRLSLAGATGESLLASLDPENRRKARKISEGGAECVVSEESAPHRRLVWASYARHRTTPPCGESAASAVHDSLLASGTATLFELRRGSDVVATHLVGIDSRRAYSLESGVDPEKGRKGEAYALVIDLLRYLAGEGVTEFDFLGVNHPTISRFKESFGGSLARYALLIPPRPLWLRGVMKMRGIPLSLEAGAEEGPRG